MVLTDDAVEWWFDVGSGTQAWDGEQIPDPRSMRRVRTPNSNAKSRHVPVFAYSTTTGGHLKFESGLEHDLLRELDRRKDVVWLVSQPMRLRLPAKRQRRRLEHTPDVLCMEQSGVVTVWDVRAKQSQDDDFNIKAELTGPACRGLGWKYEVFTGLTPVRRANLVWLHGFRREPWEYPANLAALARTNRIRTIGDVIAQDRDSGQVTASMWHAIWRGDLHCDLDRHLSRSTPLTPQVIEVDA